MNTNMIFSARLRATLHTLGYWDSSRDEPQVGRFCLDHRYLPSYVYRWLRGEVPRAERLLVLAQQLECDPWWLVGVADEPMLRKRGRRISGGSTNRAVVGIRRERGDDVALPTGRRA